MRHPKVDLSNNDQQKVASEGKAYTIEQRKKTHLLAIHKPVGKLLPLQKAKLRWRIEKGLHRTNERLGILGPADARLLQR